MEVLNKEKVLEHAKRLIDEGKFEKAIIEYRKLLDIDPKDMRIKIRIAELLARQKKVQDAVKVYQEVADSYTDDGFYLKAVTIYKNVLRLNPSLIEINFKLAELYEKMGLSKDAVYQYQILCGSLEQKGDYEALINVRLRMLDLNPHDVPNRVRLAEAYQYCGKDSEAFDEYEKLISEVEHSGKTDQLIELYEKILPHRPENIGMIKALCNIYYKRGEWKKVIAQLDKKDQLIGKETDLLLMQGDVYGRLNQIETAKGRFKLAAALFLERGEIDRAMSAYKEILVISPDSEEEVKTMISEVDADLFVKVKTEADEKRRRIEERAAAVAEETTGSQLGSDDQPLQKKDMPQPLGTAKLSPSDLKEAIRTAGAAFELGKAYHQMGLSQEAGAELTKSLNLYKNILRTGASDPVLTSNITKIEEYLKTLDIRSSETPNISSPPKEMNVVKKEETKRSVEPLRSTSEPRGEVPKFKPDPKEQASKKEFKKVEKKMDPAEKKKKNKRMGFV